MSESQKRKVGVIVTMLLVQLFTIAGVITLGVVAYQQSEVAAQATAAAEVEAAQAQENGEAIEALRDQVLELGEVPVVSQPSPPPSSPNSPRDGEDGEDAPPPTAAQVYTAVVQCFTAGVCVAPTGQPGKDGVNGTDGNDGRDAPEPTFEQMMAAVQQCFASGLCVAPTGPVGPAGPTCPDGFTATPVWLAASDSETDIPTQRQAIVCLPTPTEGEPAP